MKKPTTRLVLLIGLIICVLILSAVAVGFAREGLRHVEPARILRQAQEEEKTGASLRGYAYAYTLAIEAGVRWAMAQGAIDRMMAEKEAGQLDNALSSCGQAVDILGGYDDEGSLSYECFALEAEIQRQNELKE